MSSESEDQRINIRAPCDFDFQPTSWDNWKKRFERYLKLSGNENLDDISKIDLLLYAMGGQAEQLVKQLKVSESKEYSEILQAIDQYFKPKKNIIYERFKFNSRIQKDTESIDDFIQDLQVLINPCEYGDLRDELLRDQIIVGLKDKKISKRFLLIPDLTLKETIRLAGWLEERDATDDEKVIRKNYDHSSIHLKEKFIYGKMVNQTKN